MATDRGGRPSIFRPKIKDSRYRVQGFLTPDGSTSFERARVRLAQFADRPVERVSDADVIEAVMRGRKATRAALKKG